MRIGFSFKMLNQYLLLFIFLVVSSAFANPLDEENSSFKDPVASYNGKDISKQEFLEFLDVSANLTETDFLEAPEDILKTYLYSYALYQTYPQEIQKMELYKTADVQAMLGTIRKYILANLYLSKVSPSERALDTNNKELEYEEVPLSSLYFIAKKNGYSKSEEEFLEDNELQESLKEDYQEISLLADLALEQNLDQTVEYQKDHQWNVQSYLSDLYMKNYLDNIWDEQEIETNHLNWMSEQNFYEYQVSHIYFDDEKIAQDVLLKLKNKSITFEEAVEQYSKDRATNQFQGKIGRGGWVHFPQNDHPFSQSLASLKAGEMTEEIVKGIAGYHIIYLEDKRASQGPAYMQEDDFKEIMWRKNKEQELLDDFRSNNEIIIY